MVVTVAWPEAELHEHEGDVLAVLVIFFSAIRPLHLGQVISSTVRRAEAARPTDAETKRRQRLARPARSARTLVGLEVTEWIETDALARSMVPWLGS